MKTVSAIRLSVATAAVAFFLMAGFRAEAANITWTNTASGNWNVAANWNPNQVPSPNDTAIITNNSVTVTLNISPTVSGITLGANAGCGTNGPILFMNGQTLTLDGPLVMGACGQFTVDSGTLSGTTNSSISGAIGWTGGLLAGTLTFGTNSTLNIAGPGLNDMPNCTLTNYGTVAWTNGLMRGSGSTLIYNYGSWDSQGDLVINAAYGGAVSFYNFGTLRKSAGTNSTQFQNVALTSNGKVDVQTGVLSLQGGATFTGGTATNLTGILQLAAGNFLINGTLTSRNVQLYSVLTGTNVISGGFSWVAGNWDGATVTIASNCLMNVAGGGGNLDLANAIVTNFGTVAWSSGQLRGGGSPGTSVYNYGLWDSQGDVTFNDAFGTTTTFFNSGAFQKSAGTNSTVLSGVGFADTGTINVQTGSLALQGGGSFANPGTIAGFVSLQGGTFGLTGNVNVSAGGQMQMNGGVVAGTNGVMGGAWNWVTPVSYFAPGSALAAGTNCVLTVAGSSDMELYGALTNSGTVRLQAGTLRPRADEGAGLLFNLPGGLVDVQADVNIDVYSGGTIVNQGIFRKSGGTTNGTAVNPPFFNSGTVDVESGYISLTGGGSFSTGTVMIGPNITYLSGGTFTLSGNVNLNNAAFNGSLIAGTNGIISGTVTWDYSGSYFAPASTLTIAANGTLVLAANPGECDLYGALTNAGTIQLVSGTLRPRADQGPGQLINLPGALIDAKTDVTIDVYSGGTILNQGILRKSGGTNGTAINPYIFNSGTVDVESGYISLTGGGSFSTGTVMIGPNITYLSGGTFTLSGNVNLNNAAFNGSLIAGTNGIISGTVTWDYSGSYFAPASTLTIAANGTLVLAANPGECDLYGALTNAGTIQLVSGTLRPRADQGPGQLINLPGALIDAKTDVTIDVYSGGTILNQGTFRKSVGTNSTVVNPAFFNSGTLDAQVGNIALNGGVSLTNGTVNFGISSLSNYGTINIAGAASLTGTVKANLKNGYQPIATNTFSVLSYGSKTGIFTATNLPFADAWQTNYSPTVFSLIVLNARPTLVSPTNTLTVNELTTLTVTNTATDPDIPAQTLTFSLVSPPAGMNIGVSSGILTWTPAQTNSPSTNTISVVVTDNGVPPLSATNRFTVVVREVNVAPILPTIATQTVNELTLLTVTNTASETNIHATTTGYALINPPAGMSISTNGVITWTPAQTNSPSTNIITTVVTNSDPFDLINPNLTSTNTFTVIVKEVNVAPSLPVISTQTVNELTLLMVTNTASETNIHATTTGYALVNPPAGMSISASGIITWTPAQTNSPGTNIITTVVTNNDAFDTVNPNLTATNSFTVVVREVNVVPSLPVISTQTVNELTLLTVTNTASETNIHATITGYALVNPPAGMSISASGIITWTPAQTNSPGTNIITTVVTNNDSFDTVNPNLTATNSFTVIVKEVNVAPVLPVIPTQNVNEQALLTVVNTATESNIHATLAYSLVNPPAGMVISTNGIITWTPAQTNSPSTNIITTVVSNTDAFDTVNPHLNATNSFTAVVKEVNVVPVLPVIPTQNVNEQTVLIVTNTAAEPNIHATTTGYGLISAPAGMNISASGIINWTPSQAQSPSTNLITTVVTNNDSFDTVNPHLTATNSFTVVVSEANIAPVLPVIPNQTNNELTLLTITNTASEPNAHATTTGYGLINPPAGASISTNGIITWTPSQTQSPGTNLIITVVTNTDALDGVNPHLTATNSFTVVVKEVNVAPVLPVIPNQTNNELVLLTVTNTATEANIHAILGYTLVNPPAGATISSNGIITWTPSQTQSPGTNLIITVVTNTDALDTVNPNLSATNSFTIVVNEVNVAPVLPVIPTQTVTELTLLTVTNTATESNIHATLGYTLVNPPAGATISSNGIITWTPSDPQAPSTNIITTVVTNTDAFDTLNPHLSATNSFTVIVNQALVLTGPKWLGNGQFQFTINTLAGVNYTIQTSTNFTNWISVLEFDGSGGPVMIVDPNGATSPYRFYRVKVGP